MGILVTRSSLSAGGGGGGDWADIESDFSDMPAELGTDGRKVRMSLTGGDYGAQVDTVNGASVTVNTTGAYDGSASVRIVPPSGSTPNGNQTYSCIMRGLDIANGGANDIAQVNLGFCVRYGSRYWDLGHQAKVTGILAAQSAGGAPNASASRAAVFEAFKDVGGGDLRRVFSVTATTVASYHYPVSGTFQDDGPDTDKLLILGSTSNETNNPPLIATQWMYFHQEVDYRQDRGNANGKNRLDVYTEANGHIGFLEIPLTHRNLSGSNWDFSYAYASMIEYIGGLWNDPGTANANNYLDVSHPIVSCNRSPGDIILPPWGA
jgi:hypothetical protein